MKPMLSRKHIKHLPGYFTVEASLLMTILLPMLILLIIAGFYLHDRAFLRSASCELAAMAVNLQLYEEKDDLLRDRLILRRDHSALWADHVSGTVRADAEAYASFSGHFAVPGLISRLMGADEMSMQYKWHIRLFSPAKLIRKIRGAKYLLDTVWEG